MSRHLIMRLIFIFLLLQILVGNVRRFVGSSLRTLANAQNKFKRGKLSMISTTISNFALSCEKLLTKSKIFEIRKVLSGSLFMPKIFGVKFWSLHHFDIWFKW
jgi:hypothetical protein